MIFFKIFYPLNQTTKRLVKILSNKFSSFLANDIRIALSTSFPTSKNELTREGLVKGNIGIGKVKQKASVCLVKISWPSAENRAKNGEETEPFTA